MKLWQILNGVLGVALTVTFICLVTFICVKLLMHVFK